MKLFVALLVLTFSSSSALFCGTCEKVAQYFINKGENYVCDGVGDAACEAIGGGPEDPLADACTYLVNKFGCPYIIKKIQQGYDAPEALCDELDACHGGSNFMAMPADTDNNDGVNDFTDKSALGVGLAVAGAVVAVVATVIAVVVVLLRRRKNRSEEGQQLEDESDVYGAASTADELSA